MICFIQCIFKLNLLTLCIIKVMGKIGTYAMARENKADRDLVINS